jgi:hypothetical protein
MISDLFAGLLSFIMGVEFRGYENAIFITNIVSFFRVHFATE